MAAKLSLMLLRIGRRILGRVLLLGMSFGLSVALCEVIVRTVAPQPPSWLNVYRANPSPPYALARNVRDYCDTGESRWFVYTDEAGHRASAYPSRVDKPEAAKVLLIGDSFTFGHGVNYEDSFAGILDRSEKRYQFINAGVGGYGPSQYRQVLEQEIGTEPFPQLVIVITFLGNDIYDCIWDKHVTVRNGVLGNPGGLKSWIKRYSHLYRFIAASWHRVMPVQQRFGQLEAKLFNAACWEDGDLARGILIYQQEFGRMAEICAARKIGLCACIIPTANAVKATEVGVTTSQSLGRTLDYELPARKVRLVFETLGIPYVDATSSLAESGHKKTYFQYDGHLTPLGHRIVADVMRTKLLNLN